MGYALKECREKVGLSQEELSIMSGVSRSVIVGIENNTLQCTTTRTLLKLADALGVSVQSIFFS